MRRSVESYVDSLQAAIAAINPQEVLQLVNLLWAVRDNDRTVFLAGNGGSAATASHAAVDWMLGSQVSDPSLRVICLAESVASISATGNDYEFGDTFSRPLVSLARPGDLLVVISASGNSDNLVRAVERAGQLGLTTAALTGFDGGRLKTQCDFSVHVPTSQGDYGVSEDCHLSVVHMVKELLMLGKQSDGALSD